MTRLAGEKGGEMRAEVARVVAGAVDQRGLAAPQELHSHQIQAQGIRHAAVVSDQALAVQHRHVEPRIVRMITRGPDDGSDFARQIDAEGWRRLDPRRRQAVWRRDRAVESIVARPGVKIGRASCRERV